MLLMTAVWLSSRVFQRDSVESSSLLIIIQGHLEVMLFICCLSLFSLNSLLQMDHLTLNNNNNLTLTSGAAEANGPYSLVVFVKTAAFLTEDSQGNITLSYQ